MLGTAWPGRIVLPLIFWAAVPAPAADSTKLYVSTQGSDSWSGTLAEPNAARTDGPFASVTRARDAVRRIKAKGALKAPVDVLIRGGTYYLASTFTLEPQDSGAPACPVTYGAYSSEKPVLTGGRTLTGWKPYRGEIHSCSLKAIGLAGLRFRQLFYRGQRQVLARYPNLDPVRPRTGGFLYMDRKVNKKGKWYFWYPADSFPRKWSRPEEVEIEYFLAHNWTNAIVPLSKLRDEENRIAALGHVGGPRTLSGNRFYVQNAMEELDAPGEWYLDGRTDTVYFWPPDDELPRIGAAAPALQSVVLFQGDFGKQQFVQHVKLSHLGIECCEEHGVVLRAARHCGVIGCTVLKIGRTGIVIGAGSTFCRVAGNDIAYPGGHAIATYYNVVSPDACSDNVITNNYAHHCGEILVCSFGWGSGICISGRRNLVSHNLVHDTAYNPMNFDGWDHVMEYNVFHHGNLECTDCGGFYGWVNTKGGSGGNVIRFNRIYDMIGYGMPKPGCFQSPYFSWGIYLDDHISTTTVFGNLVYRTYRGGLMIHGGWDNVAENNVFAEGAEAQVYLANMKPDKYACMKTPPAGRPWSMSGNKIRRNIIYYANPEACLYRGSRWTDAAVAAEQNLIWHQGMPLDMRLNGLSWTTWLEKGQDANSVVADPLFVDPKNDDYRLRPESPALKLGFKPLPIDKMGLVESPERASWPVVEPKVYRDPPPPPPPPPPPADLQVGLAYRCVSRIVIDGQLGPQEWGGTAEARSLVVERLPDGRVGTRRHHAFVQRDDANLYVAVITNAGPQPSAAVEVLLQAVTPQTEVQGNVFVLRGDVSGRFGCSCAASTRRSEDLKAAVRYAARAGEGRWACEWQIPLAACGLTRRYVDECRFNVRVVEAAGKAPASWVVQHDPRAKSPAAGRLLLQPRIAANAENLLINGDFDAGDDMPSGWTTCDRASGDIPPGAEKGRCLWVKEGRGGSRCLKLHGLDPKAMRVYEYWWVQTIETPPAGTYVMTYEVRADAVAPQADNGRFYGSGWARMEKGVTPEGMNLGWSEDNHIARDRVAHWTRKQCVMNVPARVKTLYLLFGIQRATGTVWIDNARLEKGGK